MKTFYITLVLICICLTSHAADKEGKIWYESFNGDTGRGACSNFWFPSGAYLCVECDARWCITYAEQNGKIIMPKTGKKYKYPGECHDKCIEALTGGGLGMTGDPKFVQLKSFKDISNAMCKEVCPE